MKGRQSTGKYGLQIPMGFGKVRAHIHTTVMSPTVKVINLTGRLDVTSATNFRKQVSDIVLERPHYLLVDLGGVNFMDSSGLGALVSALKSMRGIDGEMVICSITEQVQVLFELTSMNKIFKIYQDREEFYSRTAIPQPPH